MTIENASPAFEAYGRVMAKIGGLEQFMRIALGESEVRRMNASGQADPQHLGRYAAKVMKMDFGTLLHQVCTKFKLAPEILTVMKEAKSFRNHLAHEFWVAHFGNLQTDRGRAIITEHCEMLQRQFEKVADLLIDLTGLDATSYITFVSAQAGDEDVFQGWESRLDAAKKAEALAGE